MDTTVIGQTEALRVLKAVAPAHVLLVGNPGTGKTHIARWYAASLVCEDGQWAKVDGGALNDYSGIGYVYINGGHRLDSYPGPAIVDEIQETDDIAQFYPILDKTINAWPNTFIFTTTDEGELPPAFLSRLRIITLAPYSQHELAEVAGLHTEKLSYQTRLAVARMSWGSPRQVIQLATLVEEVGEKNHRTIQPNEVPHVMRYLGLEFGLNKREVGILKALRDGPRSISTLAALMGTGAKTIRLWETGLVYAGLMTISSRGRDLTDQGRRLIAQVGTDDRAGGGEKEMEKSG